MRHGSLGKRGLLSLFAPKFPVVRINPLFLKLELVFQSSPFPSLLATSVCKRLLLHTTFPLWSAWPSLPDSFSVRPAGETQRTTLPTLRICPQHQEHFLKYSLSLARKPERAASHHHTHQPGLGGSWWGILQQHPPPPPAPRAWTKRSYLLSGLLIRRCSLKLG